MCGFDPFMNLVLDNTTELTKQGERKSIGMIVVRGNSVVMIESKDRL
jgi:small nuclear ribonucleoprotein G